MRPDPHFVTRAEVPKVRLSLPKAVLPRSQWPAKAKYDLRLVFEFPYSLPALPHAYFPSARARRKKRLRANARAASVTSSSLTKLIRQRVRRVKFYAFIINTLTEPRINHFFTYVLLLAEGALPLLCLRPNSPRSISKQDEGPRDQLSRAASSLRYLATF